MKDIIRRPNNRWNELIAFISGLVGGIIIGKKVSEQDVWGDIYGDVLIKKDAEDNPDEHDEKEEED